METGGLIYVSTNYGAAWVSANSPFEDWTAVTSSADSAKLVAATYPAYDGGIFVSDSTRSPQLHLSSSNGSLNISWLVPSTNMVMQESPDLSNWTTLANFPSLNYTSLQEELTFSPTNNNRFFRLITQ